MSRRPRPIALVDVRRGDDMLVQRGREPRTGKVFHRLLGGGIERGETAVEAVARELEEEIGAHLHDVRLLGWRENIFTFDGRPGHEIVAVLTGEIRQPDLLDRDHLGTIPGSTSTVHWVPAADALAGPVPLYPDGVRSCSAGDEPCLVRPPSTTSRLHAGSCQRTLRLL